MMDNCDENADCINTEGSFECVCKPGYTGDGLICTGKCRYLFIDIIRMPVTFSPL